MKSKSTATGSKGSTKIYWDKGYAYRTDRFIEWCQDNPTKRVKLFSDSTQDAREEGRTRVQLNTAKKNTYMELARYIFEHDAELSAEWLAKPQPFVAATQRRHTALRTRYNEQVKRLGQTGAGLTFDELLRADRTKGLISEIAHDFPWFSVLHGWWRSNPTYNVAFSTADPDQDFVAQAAMAFKMQPDFPMVGDSASSLLQLTDPLPTSTTPGTSAATAATTSATAASTSTLPSHADVIGGNIDANLWGLNDIDLSNMLFEDLDMDFNFASPSTFVASLPTTSSATLPPAMSFPPPPATSFAAPLPTSLPAASEETDPKFRFSTDPTAGTSSGLSASKSSHKRARTVASDRFDARDMSTSIVTTMTAIREQQTAEHRVDRHEKKVAREERLADKKQQRDHEWNMLQQRREHDLLLLTHQKSLADTELRKMEVELEILKHRERANTSGRSHVEPERGEGDEFMTQ
ncbi:hypothetical protein JVT61DRAFT_1100 [Boletus reticuloceps]|uniref:Uncharacterized protein n=1 Tax=Boletus reticuloceps TaxID=495285 RepID=A0A8I2YRT9_9AGAM|nr:hypothetical protein JVT61DRAFT_1100 [Boletus reticuloceps]